MKERPISLYPHEVRGVLSGRQTQLRRPIPDNWWRCLDDEDEDDRAQALNMCPFGVPGDQLLGRETWAPGGTPDGGDGVYYRADGDPCPERWRPSIHMPRWASRITLEVTERRIQRFHEITTEDIAAEGLVVDYSVIERPDILQFEQRQAFEKLWDATYPRYPAAADPWCWVVAVRNVSQEAHSDLIGRPA